MIALIQGEEGSQVELFKGGSALIPLQLLSDGTVGPTGQVEQKGTPLDVAGDTTTVEVYDTQDRRNAVVKSLATTIVTATSGYLTVTVATATIDFGPGTYFGFVKRLENTGTTVEFSRRFFTVVIK
jgi:hypothetical protein